MARKIGQIIRLGPSTWLVRIYVGRDSGKPVTSPFIGIDPARGLEAARCWASGTSQLRWQ